MTIPNVHFVFPSKATTNTQAIGFFRTEKNEVTGKAIYFNALPKTDANGSELLLKICGGFIEYGQLKSFYLAAKTYFSISSEPIGVKYVLTTQRQNGNSIVPTETIF